MYCIYFSFFFSNIALIRLFFCFSVSLCVCVYVVCTCVVVMQDPIALQTSEKKRFQIRIGSEVGKGVTRTVPVESVIDLCTLLYPVCVCVCVFVGLCLA